MKIEHAMDAIAEYTCEFSGMERASVEFVVTSTLALLREAKYDEATDLASKQPPELFHLLKSLTAVVQHEGAEALTATAYTDALQKVAPRDTAATAGNFERFWVAARQLGKPIAELTEDQIRAVFFAQWGGYFSAAQRMMLSAPGKIPALQTTGRTAVAALAGLFATPTSAGSTQQQYETYDALRAAFRRKLDELLIPGPNAVRLLVNGNTQLGVAGGDFSRSSVLLYLLGLLTNLTPTEQAQVRGLATGFALRMPANGSTRPTSSSFLKHHSRNGRLTEFQIFFTTVTPSSIVYQIVAYFLRQLALAKTNADVEEIMATLGVNKEVLERYATANDGRYASTQIAQELPVVVLRHCMEAGILLNPAQVADTQYADWVHHANGAAATTKDAAIAAILSRVNEQYGAKWNLDDSASAAASAAAVAQ